jgi:hypothetical protein
VGVVVVRGGAAAAVIYLVDLCGDVSLDLGRVQRGDSRLLLLLLLLLLLVRPLRLRLHLSSPIRR